MNCSTYSWTDTSDVQKVRAEHGQPCGGPEPRGNKTEEANQQVQTLLQLSQALVDEAASNATTLEIGRQGSRTIEPEVSTIRKNAEQVLPPGKRLVLAVSYSMRATSLTEKARSTAHELHQ